MLLRVSWETATWNFERQTQPTTHPLRTRAHHGDRKRTMIREVKSNLWS